MILADGINLPIVAGLGFAVFVPLTLFVSAVESLVLRLLLGIPFLKSFKTVIIANVLSTVAGWFVYGFQDALISAMGISTIPDFAGRYLWAAMVLVVIYYCKSVLLEGLYVARRKIAKSFAVTRRKLWAGVLVANAASYLFVGPLFYFSTRPVFEGISIVDDPAAVADCKDRIYFIDPQDHLCRIEAGGRDRQTVVPYPVADFVVSADQTRFLYRGKDGCLDFHCRQWQQPVLVWKTEQKFFFDGADISADNTRVAYVEELGEIELANVVKGGRQTPTGYEWEDGKRYRWIIKVFDIARQKVETEMPLTTKRDFSPSIGWDKKDSYLLWCSYDKELIALSKPHELAGNYRRAGGCHRWSGGDWGIPLSETDVQGGIKLYVYPYLGSALQVSRGEHVLVVFRHDYGLLGLGFGGPSEASFLSKPGCVVFQARDCLYVLNALTRRLALLAVGRHHVLTNRRFQMSFERKKDPPPTTATQPG